MGSNTSRESTFHFKKFSVRDNASAMKVGTDGVILGAWTTVPDKGSVVDVGCGTGLIALMLAQRGAREVFAVEIDSAAAEEAASNVAASPWNDLIKVIADDAMTIDHGTPAMIVSNPPFFDSSLKSPDISRAAARHEGSLSFAGLMTLAARCLAPRGRLAFISPADRESGIDFDCAMAGMEVVRKTYVSHSPDATPRRILWEMMRHGECNDLPHTCDSLAIRNADGRYSSEYKDLTADFYLDKTFMK